ncbi:hypothetical protein BGZ70_008801 [Mortierella alpina]|uniref:HTH CENPB-type domain-containing protein n=1 Tax=Mortierella alpina TaxID=64518 RepID=A0A9P6J2S7_MORAP|nr:hypothetical protein BGZ70_008801 [Mortierella alpina]
MGVFGEKHTSLTREQKRQLIHQADTHKLRPTEVCDWVQATWGLRIARVTVYSILHKQRASLMAGVNGLSSSTSVISGADAKSTSSSSTLTAASDECLERNKESGRVNKYRASPNKNKPKPKDGVSTVAGKSSASGAEKATQRKTAGKRDRSCSVMSDRSSSSSADGAGEVGTRWEGQLKRVREPASVELDRAMVEFLKSPASVDSQGRRLNDAELQSHALRLAQSIPSASRMRCSFGWLRHFKRRLGVQWVADRLGRHRWVVEMDHQQHSSSSVAAALASGSVPGHEEPEIKTEDQQGAERILEAIQSRMGQGRSASSVVPAPLDQECKAGQRASSQQKKARTLLDLPSNFDDASILSIQPAHSQHQQPQPQQQQQQQSPESILNSYPNLFGTMSSLHTVSSPALSMGTIAPLATTLDPNKLTTSTVTSPSAFGMSVDGKMRKVPSKEEAYDMLQSLLMYYEQDHSYIGEQQTLLLPRWIHQQRQIMHQTQESENQMIWMRQQQQQQQQFHQQQSFSLFPYQSFGVGPSSADIHPYHRHHSSFSSSVSSHPSLSPPALSPLSPGSPLSPMTPHSPNMSPFSLGLNDDTPMNNPFMAAKAADTIFSSPMTGLGHQTLSGHHPFSLASLQAS